MPGLASSDYEQRLAAIACCAFLQSEQGTALLADLATSDPESGVREAALWALGFAGGTVDSTMMTTCAGRVRDSIVSPDGPINWWLL
jgi:hypothetical protein